MLNLKEKIVAVAMLVSMSSLGQSFEKGKIIAGLNYDFSIYSTESYDKQTRVTETDGAAANIFSGWGEYALTDRLGAGLRLAGFSYIVEPDSATGIRPKGRSFDYGLFVNYHLVKKTRFDLPLGLSFGGSGFKYQSNLPDNGIAKDHGIFINAGLNPRIYFGKFGINFKLAYAMFIYNSVDFSTNAMVENNSISFKGKGANIGLGFQYRIN